MKKDNKILDIFLNIILVILGGGFITLSFYMKGWKLNTFLYTIVAFLGAILIFKVLMNIYNYFINKDKKKTLSVKEITLIGIQSALSIILYYVASLIPSIPFFPPWLDLFNFSEIPALITGFIYGPYAGSLVILVRFFVKLPGTFTAGVGELADLILGLVLVIVSSIIYKRHRSLKGALIGTSSSMLVCSLTACLLNYLVLIPAYVNLAGFSYETLASMLSYMGNVTVDNFMVYYIFIGVLPFNIARYVMIFIITFITYKKIHLLIDRLVNDDKEKDVEN